MSRKQRSQSGFTIVEIIVVTAIIAILAAVAISSVRDYSRRASLSEVVLAVTKCKNTIAESYAVLDSAPDAGRWGCEVGGNTGNYSGHVQTSSNGVIRVAVINLDRLVNERYIYLVPARNDGTTAMVTPNDLGQGVRSWICGSDWMPVRNALPANCRSDTTTYASQEYH